MGDVVIIALWVRLTLAGLTLLSGWLLWHLRRRHLLHRLGSGVLTAALLLLTVAAQVNAHYAYLPRLRDAMDVIDPGTAYPTLSPAALHRPAAGRRLHGGVLRLRLPDGHDGLGASSALVYVPDVYFTDPTRHFPVVYLLHGSPGSSVDWFRAAEADRVGATLARQGRPVLLVAPRMSRNWLDDSECVDGRHEAIERHLLDVVVPTVERDLRVVADRSGRILAGNSAGGFCALNLGLRHRDLFGTIVDLSGETAPTHTGGLVGLFGRRPDLRQVVAANSPLTYAPVMPVGPPVRLRMDSGRGDRSIVRQQTAFVRAVAGRPDLDLSVVLRPGGHTYGVWRPALLAGLEWALDPAV